MENSKFKVGDKVYHASNSTILWVIERLEGEEAFCSTILKGAYEQKKETFALTSIILYKKPQIRSATIKEGNFW